MKALALCICLTLALNTLNTQAATAWQSRTLLSDFYAEGAATGDINGDGIPDLVYGPFWFAGPDFTEARRFTSGSPFSPLAYSDNFFSYILDVNQNGRNDIIVFGFPGREVRLYLNPGPQSLDSDWPVHVIIDQLCHEAPQLIDLIPGGLPEIVGSRDTAYGYYSAGLDPTQPWLWNPVSTPGKAAKPFGHGMGVGDLNGNGRLDIIEKNLWFEQPADPTTEPWKEHRWAIMNYGGGGAQILVDDVDGDGDADLITSLNAHGYGIAWFEQTAPGKFKRHDIIGQSSTDNPHGVNFSQPHGLALVDVDGDGRRDFVTGKRWYAHRGRDPGAHQEPVVYWFRNTATADGIEFVPHQISASTGIGVNVPIADLNQDGLPDVISANKRGLTIHLQQPNAEHQPAERWQIHGGRPQDHYADGLPAHQAAAHFELPPGFSIDLIAAEPDLTQPIAMCFDARGRIWLIEGHTYPQRAPDGQGKDRILILEDSNGDGNFDTRKIFAENINLASGIEVGFGGVFVGAAPHLLFYPDADGDDIPDTAPQILLDGWGWQDTHETLNSFTWGPDGWLYGCHGVFTHSNVGPPGSRDAERQPINAGVWRYHPVSKRFEIFAEGSSNPWGLDFDAHGNAFITACVIPHLYHVIQGARYQRQAGQHFNPHLFEDIQTIADHLHYTGNIRAHAFWGGVNKETAAAAPNDTSALGGGHAHCGLAIYQAQEFPSNYRGDLFFSNLHGHRIIRERLEQDGSGHISRHLPDFALSNDHRFIGVGVMQGPDGALYISDWQDAQTCHHRDVEIWDRSTGRLYRIRHGDLKSTRLNLPAQTDLELVTTLTHPNTFHARQAQRLLQERSANGKINAPQLKQSLLALITGHPDNTPIQLRAYWTLHSCGLLSEQDLITHLSHPNEQIRSWTLQFLGEPQTPLPPATLQTIAERITTETSMVTRRYAASLLQRLPLDQRWPIAQALLSHSTDQYDRNLPLPAWFGIEPLVQADPDRALALAESATWPQIQSFIARRAALSEPGRSALMRSLAAATSSTTFLTRATLLLNVLADLPPLSSPPEWPQIRATGEKLQGKKSDLNPVLLRLGARFADATTFPHWQTIATNPQLPAKDRIEALDLLLAGRDPQLPDLARSLLDQKNLHEILLKSLRSDTHQTTADALVANLNDFTPQLRIEAINILAGTAQSALTLLRAVDSKSIQPSLISPVLLDQFERFDNPEISQLISRHWVRGGEAINPQQLSNAIQQWKRKLNPKLLADANPSRGRSIYQTTCGSCHTLFGEGIALGPDLTGSNRADLGYLLENVLAPSAIVGKDYQLNIFTLHNGSVLSGMVREINEQFIKLVMPGGSTTDIPQNDVKQRQELPQSLMPPGLFDNMPLLDVADLVRYLASPAQIPLPHEMEKAISPIEPPPPGVTRIEASTLLANASKTSGQLRIQNMAGFGPHWSADQQLWWTGAKPADSLTLQLPDIQPGTRSLTLHTTTAKDYAQIKVLINGNIREADLYTPKVLPGPALTFSQINVSPSEPLTIQIQITGSHPEAIPSHMIGIDRIEIQ